MVCHLAQKSKKIHKHIYDFLSEAIKYNINIIKDIIILITVTS